MFDLGSAVVLGLVVMGLVTMVHTLVYGPGPDRVKVVSCLVVAFIAVQVVAASDFANEQVVLNRKLDSLNFWSQMVIVLLVAGVASAVWNIGVKAISNIGTPMPKYPTHKLHGNGGTAPVAGTGLTGLRSEFDPNAPTPGP